MELSRRALKKREDGLWIRKIRQKTSDMTDFENQKEALGNVVKIYRNDGAAWLCVTGTAQKRVFGQRPCQKLSRLRLEGVVAVLHV